MVNKAFISPKFMPKKQINKQNSYLLLAFLQSGSVPELDMHESKHFLPGQFVHSESTMFIKSYKIVQGFVLSSLYLLNNSLQKEDKAIFRELHQ
jgi:hypothetical protein